MNKKASPTVKQENGFNFSSIFPYIAIPIAYIFAQLLYVYVLGDAANFEGGDPIKGHPLNMRGTIHKGGFIVPLLITVNTIVLIFFYERLTTILIIAKGRPWWLIFTGPLIRLIFFKKLPDSTLVKRVNYLLSESKVQEALALCDQQKSSVASVLRSGLLKYKEMEENTSLEKEEKINVIKQEIEEATALELPMLSKNLVILSTCGSLGVLVGLLGTVKGMISSFEAMATAGAPDATALSLGISEALINTFLGIMASAIAIIIYNFFNTRIDSMTFAMDEAGLTVSQSFGKNH
ncbi:MAG: MotA/TolQ/ExbB proton channel family protein [Sediminibacterium sp.]